MKGMSLFFQKVFLTFIKSVKQNHVSREELLLKSIFKSKQKKGETSGY